MKIKTQIIIVLISFFTLSSCLNRNEKEVLGKYELYKYELKDKKIELDNFSKLILKKDKTFELKYHSQIINGEWKVDDYGDWTLIELKSKATVTEGKILGNSILFESGKIFEMDNFEEMEYTRIVDLK